ncbi:hypothetical protein Tco_0315569 [Tanacetum coccineum]
MISRWFYANENLFERHVYSVVMAMYACLSCLVGLRLLVKVRRFLPYIILHPNRWLNSNKDVNRNQHVNSSFTPECVLELPVVGVVLLCKIITILKTSTPYPSRKIRRIRACTHQRPQRNKAQYAVSGVDQYAVLEMWNEYNILEDIKRGSYSKKSPIRRIQSLDTPYAQWQSRFLRYIDTRPNGDALRKCILQGPYTPSIVILLAVPATDNTPAVLKRTAVETILNMSPENKAHYESEKEAIHLLLTGIGDEIYSTVDACKTAHEMWIAIERLQQGESLNIQDVKTNLFWEFGKFTSYDGETMESYYSKFYKMMNEMIRNNLTVATMQYQKEVNEIRAERIAKNANPLALVAAA